jgi:enterochelin esterase-like enzyme
MPALFITVVLAVLILVFTARGRRRHRRLLTTIEVVTLRGVHATHLENQRDVYVYLPPGYRTNPGLRYEVLYVNDGQEREALGLQETLARLMLSGKIRPIIAAAIPTNDDRLHEYGTALCPNSRGLGSKAPAYSDFIIDDLLPLMNREFRTRSPGAFTGVSLGGLSAFDIVWNHPSLFKTAGIMSGSFWWHTSQSDDWNEADPRIAHAMVRESEYREGFRGWFQAGSRDEVSDRDQDGIIDAIQDTLELIEELVALGYRREIDVRYVETRGGRHDYETWARVLPDFLMWAFKPGSPPLEEISLNDLPRLQ